jgi:hypothetical protein
MVAALWVTGCASGPHVTKFEEGVALEKAGKPDDALRAYYAALETAPGLVEARQNVGTIYYEQKKYDKAEREFRLILSQDGERVAARENLAVALEAKGGQEEEALQHWQTALAKEERPEWKNYGRASVTRLEKKIQAEALAPPSDVDRIPAFAAKARPNDVAVVIGIERYQKLPLARHAKGDAETVAKYLRALGYPARNVEVLFNDQATLTGIKVALESWLPSRVQSDSRVLVYYAGHGSPDPVTGEAYLVPHDGDPALLKDTAYPLKTLYAKLADLKAGQVVVTLDSCFSGQGGRSVMMEGRPAIAKIDDPVLASPRLAVLSAAQGTQISTSSREKRHGVFTYHFLKALQDGKTQLGDIYDYLGPRVEDEAKLQNVQQSPVLRPSASDVRRFTVWDKETASP